MKKDNEEKVPKPPENSPFAGCTIFIVAGAVLLFLIIFSVVVLFRQFDAIKKFTDVEPLTIEQVALEDKAKELNEVAEKIERFRTDLVDAKVTKITLNRAEINLAISAYSQFEELRNALSVREISENGIICDISFKLNGRPRISDQGESGVLSSDPRYLNGSIIVKPALLDGEVVLEVLDISVKNAEVPREFILQMSPYRIAERYIGEEPLGQAMLKLTAIELANDEVTFISDENIEPVHAITNDQVDVAGSRLFAILGIAASVFLVFVALILFIGLRASRKKKALEEA